MPEDNKYTTFLDDLDELPHRQRPLVLLALSGGLDSIYRLYRFLVSGKVNVHVMHLNYGFSEDQITMQKEASMKVVSYLRENGYVFETFYVDVSSDAEDFIPSNYLQVCSTIALHLSLNQNKYYSFFALGGCMEDLVRTVDSRQIQHETEIVNSVFDGIMVKQLRDELRTKEQMWAALPKSLRKHAWYCTSPLFGKQCGDCMKCTDMQDCK